MQQRRIPATLTEFNNHLRNVNNYLHKIEEGATLMRGELLGMTAAELVTLGHFMQVWSSGDPLHPGVWDLHSDKTRKTALTRKNILQIMKDFSQFFRPLLTRMSGSAIINNADRGALLIAAPVTKRSRPKLAIAVQCTVLPILIGGGRIKFKCYPAHTEGRAHKPPRADAVEIAYRLFLPHQLSPTGEEIPIPSLIGPNDNTTKIISTRASFTFDLDDKALGYQMQFYARWINTKYPQLASPWNGVWSFFIG
jgi:hypothetical protein